MEEGPPEMPLAERPQRRLLGSARRVCRGAWQLARGDLRKVVVPLRLAVVGALQVDPGRLVGLSPPEVLGGPHLPITNGVLSAGGEEVVIVLQLANAVRLLGHVGKDFKVVPWETARACTSAPGQSPWGTSPGTGAAASVAPWRSAKSTASSCVSNLSLTCPRTFSPLRYPIRGLVHPKAGRTGRRRAVVARQHTETSEVPLAALPLNVHSGLNVSSHRCVLAVPRERGEREGR